MNVLIVHVHPEPRSFNGALTRTAARALREQGYAVEVSDLYAMKWKPVADADDYAGPREDQGYLRIDREQTFAHDAGARGIATRSRPSPSGRPASPPRPGHGNGQVTPGNLLDGRPQSFIAGHGG
jgi:hypothetical protein